MKNVLVTGANKGIGFEVAKQLAELGYFVFLGCRDLKKGLEAVDSLKELDILNVEALKIDVSDLASVREAASVLTSKIEVLDVLINAGSLESR
ncbi:MAG: SDR family NAD(P)-dependent oxidoreductase [Pedobacter sp.]|nr:MAG: SDR family NAD(P)-dependent oxidoreductase [Pedobacter sp.]